MKRLIAAAALALPVLPLLADETSDHVKAALAKSRPAVHTLKCVVSVEVQGQTQDIPVEVPVAGLDATGLLVAPNPEDMLNVPDNMRANITTSTKNFQVVTAEGKELEARTVGRDAEFGLLFLRLTDKGAAALPALPAAGKATLDLGDEVFLIGQLSSRHPETICLPTRVASVIQKPRRMYLTTESLGLGNVALSPDGSPVGLTARVKEKDPDSDRQNAMVVVLPLSHVVEAAKGVHEEKAEEKPAEEKPAEESPK